MVKTMKRMFLREVSAVDTPAQTPAQAVLMKSAKPVTKGLGMTNVVDGHSHTLLTHNYDGSEARMGSTDYQNGHSHQWIRDERGNIVFTTSQGHTHSVAVMSKNDDGTLANQSSTNNPASATAKGGNEHPMTKEEIAALEKAVQDANARAERAERLAQLTDTQRELFKSLSPEAQSEFLTLTPEQRNARVAKSLESNPVVETIDGMEFRKNDDPRMLAMAKQARQDREKAREAEKRLHVEQLNKRAEGLAHLPGDAETRVALLEAVDTLPVEKREKVEALLKAHDLKLSATANQLGTAATPSGDNDAANKLDEMAKAVQKSEPSLTFAQAYAKAIKSDEGKLLYASMRS